MAKYINQKHNDYKKTISEVNFPVVKKLYAYFVALDSVRRRVRYVSILNCPWKLKVTAV